MRKIHVNMIKCACKAPLYAGMFGKLLYQHKKAFRLPIKYIFSMVLYSLCVFQFILFQAGGIFPRTSVNSPLYVRHPYMQGCLVNLPRSQIRTADVRSWENEFLTCCFLCSLMYGSFYKWRRDFFKK